MLIATILGIAGVKSRAKGSKGFFNKYLKRSREWGSTFCHDGSPTWDCVGDISYLSNVFDDAGFERNSVNPDVVYSHMLLRDCNFKPSKILMTNYESDSFFDLHSRLRGNPSPIFVFCINLQDATDYQFKNAGLMIDSLSATTNGKLSKNRNVEIFDASSSDKERLQALNYHVYTYRVSSDDMKIPVEGVDLMYVVGFLSKQPRKYYSQPVFPSFLEFDNFDDIKTSSILVDSSVSDSIYTRVSIPNVSGYNPKYIKIGEDVESVHINPFYWKIGKLTASYVVDSSGTRTLSDKELFGVFDASYKGYRSFKSAFDDVMKYSSNRGLLVLLDAISSLLDCRASNHKIVNDFLTGFNNSVTPNDFVSEVKIGGMFSGVGGFEAGVIKGLGMRGIRSSVSWDYEIDFPAQEVFSARFPGAIPMGSIESNSVPEYVDVVTMGFPCIDVSMAGSRRGIAGGKYSGLFFDGLKKCNEINPKFIVLENVGGILHRNKSTGIAPIQTVINELQKTGWNMDWVTVTARNFGAPHIRERWFAVCYRPESVSDFVMVDADEVFNSNSSSFPKFGAVRNGVVYRCSPKIPLDMGFRSQRNFPTPIATDWAKRSTGGLRRSVESKTQSPPSKVLSPEFSRWMMGFPKGWFDKRPGVVNIESPLLWSRGNNPKVLVGRQKIDSDFRNHHKMMGNAIVPQIPAFIFYAFLYKYFL